jgi:hypothetical protein
LTTGSSLSVASFPEVLHFFRSQECLALQKQRDNETFQRREKMKKRPHKEDGQANASKKHKGEKKDDFAANVLDEQGDYSHSCFLVETMVQIESFLTSEFHLEFHTMPIHSIVERTQSP